jgi:hypothetical protein
MNTKSKFEWAIHDSSQLLLKKADTHRSQEFEGAGHRWQFELRRNTNSYIDPYIMRIGKDAAKSVLSAVKCVFAFVNPLNKINNYTTGMAF